MRLAKKHSTSDIQGTRRQQDSRPYGEAGSTVDQTAKRHSINREGLHSYGLDLDSNPGGNSFLNRNASAAGLPHSHFHPPELESEALSSQHHQSVEILNRDNTQPDENIGALELG